MKWRERTYCGDLGISQCGKPVLLMGWVDAIRDHGNLLFIHLRDVRGIVQVVFNPQVSMKSYEKAISLREEFVIEVEGKVALRAESTENPHLKTGDIEVFAEHLTILATSGKLPFPISEKAMSLGEEIQTGPASVEEDLRLRFRYLDLRRPSVQERFLKRHHIAAAIREYLDSLNFVEVETPVLTKSTPEGARDYLVPSRIHRGKFYALPQSPQLFKQLLMISGMDRYYQIVKCFRDEDLRPNRQPEFTQLDMEASFIDEEFIYELVEELIIRIFTVGGIELSGPFPRMTYEEAMESYGTDRPDLRFDMAFENVTDILQDTRYGVFREIIKAGGLVKGFCVKGRSGALSKNVLQNEYALKIAPSLGAKGLTWMRVVDGILQSNISQFFSTGELEDLSRLFRADEGDVLMMIADKSSELVNRVLCSLRLHVAERFNLIPENRHCPLWVTDFPLFELKGDEISSQHHPFTMPDRTDFDPSSRQELLSLHSRAYDIVMNGEELGGGSIRINSMELQKKIFRAVGMGRDEIEGRFGFFLRALEYGTPPHGGLALGLDRVIAMVLKAPSIRDVIAFPKNRSAVCPLTDAPSSVNPAQLLELGLEIRTLTEVDQKAADTKNPGRLEGISVDEVRRVAELARLRLADFEADLFQKELSAVLKHFETLQSLNTGGVRPMSHVVETINVWREDKSEKPMDPQALLSGAPVAEKGCFKVPKILEG